MNGIGDFDLLLLDTTDLCHEDARELEQFLKEKKIRWKWVEDWSEI